MKGFTQFFQKAKDRGVGLVFETWLAKQIEPYGSVIEFSLDSQRKTFRLEVLLKGESQPVSVTVTEYEVMEDAGKLSLVLKKCAASREWVTLVLQQFVCGKKLLLPDQYAGMIKLAL